MQNNKSIECKYYRGTLCYTIGAQKSITTSNDFAFAESFNLLPKSEKTGYK